MRVLADYSWRDWQRLRPVTHWLKTLRYNFQREAYVRRSARTDVTAVGQLIGRRVLVTIAFEDPEAIELQAQLVVRFVPGVAYIVADMSMNEHAAAEIAAIEARHKVSYVRLPDGPLRR